MIRRLNNREKKILVLTLAVLISAFVYNGFIGPLQEKRRSLNEEITIKRGQLEENLGILRNIQETDGRYYAYLKQFQHSGSNEETSSSILSELERISGELGLHVTDLKPQKIEEGSYERRYSISLIINSPFTDIVRFLYEVQRPPYYFDVKETEFSKIERGNRSNITTHLVLEKAYAVSDEDNELLGKMPTGILPVKEVRPFDEYAKQLQERGLFRSLKDQEIVESPALKKALPALHQRIKLIGILVDGDSKAIVEDLKEKQTHFLSRGESLGAVLLEDIQEDKVIFKYNDERVEMAP